MKVIFVSSLDPDDLQAFMRNITFDRKVLHKTLKDYIFMAVPSSVSFQSMDIDSAIDMLKKERDAKG